MSKTFDQGKEEVAKLCRYFATNRQAFLAPGVKEAHVRQSLIDPLFEALGWDVRNTAMVAPQYREVIPEDSLDVEGHKKAPDYTFRVGPLPKFYTEAKKCGVDINADPGPAYQLRRYGWSAKVALSVLTDFEELGVYDCTLRPRPSDKASHARIQYFRFEEYPDRWRELWGVFSREAVWSGAFDQYAASKRKRGTSEVDVEFLKEIEGWRDTLARNIALRNKDLSSDDLNAAVQRTIDRVVFLRMAEDRGIELEEQLLGLCEQDDIYSRFMRDLCRRADRKYNSGLFHFQKEPGVSEDPDRITPGLTVDDKVFKPILQSLYFAHGCPYHFGVLPVEILGTVYERFLGKVIRLTAGHQAKVEEKPEVRKAGGVYYTPAYIVEYIVRHTVGRQIEGQSPAQLAGGKDKPPLRVLDMACGSGSFLVGAYRCLLDHCLKWYIEHKPATHKRTVYQDPRSGQWRFTVEEKKRILTTHIFGVDIDPQAVEVSKLSLLLKVLEGETEQSLQLGLLSFSDRALPNLADNIKCGNSLIGPDYFTGKLIPDPDEMKRVNPFDWNQGFPDAMKAGGFDCIIGNPPYSNYSARDSMRAYFRRNRMKTELRTLTDVIDYCMNTYSRVSSGCKDLYKWFTYKSLGLTTQDGSVGLIISNTWMALPKYADLKKCVFDLGGDVSVVDMGFGVFALTVPTCLLICKKGGTDSPRYADLRDERSKEQSLQIDLHFRELTAGGHVPNLPIVEKYLTHWPTELRLGGWMSLREGQHIQRCDLVKGHAPDHVPVIDSKNMGRYEFAWEPRYSYKSPNTATFRQTSGVRVVIRKTGDRIIATITPPVQGYVLQSLYQSVHIDSRVKPEYLLGLLNSKFMTFVYQNSEFGQKGRTMAQFRKGNLDRLPVPRLDFSDNSDVRRHDRMISLVDSMLALHQQLAAAKSEAQKTVIQRQIDATDAEIDRLVYDLYGLNEEEIALVEGAAPARRA